MKKNKLFLPIFLLVVLSFSCSAKDDSSLIMSVSDKEYSLYALNRTAKKAQIDRPEKSKYLYFAFPESVYLGTEEEMSPLTEKNALQLLISRKDGGSAFSFGWLYESDFTSETSYRLKKQLTQRPMVTGSFSGDGEFLVSMTFPKDKKAKGFFIYSESITTVESVSIVDSKEGFLLSGSVPWFGFSANGGAIVGKNPVQNFVQHKDKKVTIHLTPFNENNSQKINVVTNQKQIKISQAPNQKTISLYPSVLQPESETVSINVENGFDFVTGIVYEPFKNDSVLDPILVDPGFICRWPTSSWRRPDFEVFAWEQFPNVLYFDTIDYDIQDKFFKRLAFFAEKAGYVGKLATDSAMAGLHGFNAHDYRAETLASFFELARLNNFPLNDYELMLRDILVSCGIVIKRGDGSFDEGIGALVSISKESTTSLRNTFIAHEGLHCLYFTDEDFRKFVAKVYEATDPMSLNFLTRYFSVTASLNYDLKDTYLIQNEFMAYIMQQPVNLVAEYFTKILATKKTINKTNPELVEYILQTNAQGFVISAKQIDSYLRARWGYAGGRVWLVEY